jgi:hypothetical protein
MKRFEDRQATYRWSDRRDVAVPDRRQDDELE